MTKDIICGGCPPRKSTYLQLRVVLIETYRNNGSMGCKTIKLRGTLVSNKTVHRCWLKAGERLHSECGKT